MNSLLAQLFRQTQEARFHDYQKAMDQELRHDARIHTLQQALFDVLEYLGSKDNAITPDTDPMMRVLLQDENELRAKIKKVLSETSEFTPAPSSSHLQPDAAATTPRPEPPQPGEITA